MTERVWQVAFTAGELEAAFTALMSLKFAGGDTVSALGKVAAVREEIRR